MTTWGKLIDKLDSKHFVGREQELSDFLDEIRRSQPDFLIYFISGQGGVGKTELLKKYKGIAENNNYIVVDCDEQQGDIPSILYRFSKQMADRGYELDNFIGKHKKYQQVRQEIESDPNAPLGLAGFLGQSIARVGLELADDVPVLRQGLKLIDKDTVSTQVGEWTKYLAQKMSSKSEDFALIRDPVFTLSSLFFKDLNEIAESKCILLCFDNFEKSRNYLDAWITEIREYEPSSQIRLAIASRTIPGMEWEKLNHVTMHVTLDKFTRKEANQYLDLVGITNKQRRTEILEFSGHMPILMSWLASPSRDDPDPTIPTANIVDRYLRWVDDPVLRDVALQSSIPRFFNIDILTLLFKGKTVSELEKVFEWLRKQPFISQGQDGWQYHDVVRRHMVNYQTQRSYDNVILFHNQIAAYYGEKVKELKLTGVDRWKNRYAQRFIIEINYHNLISAPSVNWTEFVNTFVYALKYSLSFAKRLVEIISQAELLERLDHRQHKIIDLFTEQLKIINKRARWNGLKLYDFLGELDYLEPEAHSFILYLRGEATRILTEDYGKALEYLNKSIELNPLDAEVYAEKGEIFVNRKKYKGAIVEFDHAIEINPKYHWAYERKGYSLYYLRFYENAIDMLNKAEQTNKNCSYTYAYRGASYLALDQLEQALVDLNKSIEIDSDYPWALLRRGEVYLGKNEFDYALAEFESIFNKFSKEYDLNHECLKNIGLSLMGLKKYDEAANKFMASLEENPRCSHCWSALIETYEKMNSRDQVPELIVTSKYPNIKFDEMVYLCRASALAHNGYKEAIDDVKAALRIKPNVVIKDWVGLNILGLLLARQGDYANAIECYMLTHDDYVRAYNIAIALALWKGIDSATNQIRIAIEYLNEFTKDDKRSQGIRLYGLAGIEAVKNNKSVALKLLAEAINFNPAVLEYARNTDPAWNCLRAEGEFQTIIS